MMLVMMLVVTLGLGLLAGTVTVTVSGLNWTERGLLSLFLQESALFMLLFLMAGANFVSTVSFTSSAAMSMFFSSSANVSLGTMI